MKLLAVKRLVLPLSYRDFRLLWIGQTISALGNPFQVVALVWLVLQLKGSPLDLATTMLALTIPQAMVTLAGGVLIDRFKECIGLFPIKDMMEGTKGPTISLRYTTPQCE